MQDSALNKLFMVLLGANPPRRNVEQHDFFFGIGTSMKDLIPQMMAFWPEAGSTLHVDGWREVTKISGFEIRVSEKKDRMVADKRQQIHTEKLFFINLGGYQSNKLEEQHYTILTVQLDRSTAIQDAKKTIFFKTNTIKGGNSHIDEDYGVDVDEVYNIDEILDPRLKERFQIEIIPNPDLPPDEIHLGYFKLSKF
jgi:hypothetical protein